MELGGCPGEPSCGSDRSVLLSARRSHVRIARGWFGVAGGIGAEVEETANHRKSEALQQQVQHHHNEDGALAVAGERFHLSRVNAVEVARVWAAVATEASCAPLPSSNGQVSIGVQPCECAAPPPSRLAWSPLSRPAAISTLVMRGIISTAWVR